MVCKHCGYDKYVKNGIVGGKQRYECKNCAKTFREGDLREVYTDEKRLRVVKWYLEGAGIMSIERMEGVPISFFFLTNKLCYLYLVRNT